MRTVGVDLAADPARTAVAWIDWSSDGARVVRVETHAEDDLIVEAVLGADKAGIDCPLGWPDAFVDFVTAHRTGHVRPGTSGRAWRRDLTLRVTDKVTHELTGLTPLSVSADRIAHPAMRCAALQAELALRGHAVDRTGAGTVVEVYPAASLYRWGLAHRGYKRAANRTELARLAGELQAAAPWLDLAAFTPLSSSSDDAFDAVIAALTARAAHLGKTTQAPPEHRKAASTEGWITLPTTPLHTLHP